MVHDTEQKARIQGVSYQMKNFNFLFGTMLGEIISKGSSTSKKKGGNS